MKNTSWRLSIRAAVVLIGGAAPMGFSADGISDTLSPSDIVNKAKEKYASLTSYSDQGKVVATLSGMTITTTFTIKMARPGLYRVDWTENEETPFSTTTTKPQAVWSAGQGDFLKMGRGLEKQANQEMALSGAAGISSGAASTIPGSFFKMKWGFLKGPMLDEKRKADEKVGDSDCYVLVNESNGRSTTLWVGKQDFLIHQVRTVTSAEAMKAILEKASKNFSDIGAKMPKIEAQGSVSTETHTNIVLNPKLSPADFEQ